MPQELHTRLATRLKQIQDHKRQTDAVREILLQSKLHEHGGSDPTHGADPEHRSPVARENLRTLLKRGHETAQSNEFDNVVHQRMEQAPEIHDTKRLVREKEDKIKAIKKESLWKRAQRANKARQKPPEHASHAERLAHEEAQKRCQHDDPHHHEDVVHHSHL